MKDAASRPSSESLSLSQQHQALREECRMVLPGIQALFGFQLVAVFNQGFSEKLSLGGQRLHFAAILLVAISAGLVISVDVVLIGGVIVGALPGLLIGAALLSVLLLLWFALPRLRWFAAKPGR